MTRTRRRQILRYTIPTGDREGIRERLGGTSVQIKPFPERPEPSALKAA